MRPERKPPNLLGGGCHITAWWGGAADHALLESVYVVIEAGIGTNGTMAARVSGLTLDADAVHGDGWTGGGL